MSTALALYRPEARAAAVKRLGGDPAFCRVAAELLRDDNDSLKNKTGRFRVSFLNGNRCHIAEVPASGSLLTWRGVCDLVPALTSCLSLDPGPPDSVEDPGFCYAVLYAPESRSSARTLWKRRPHSAAIMADLFDPHSPRTFSPGPFRLTFGTPASVTASDKFLAHVSSGYFLNLQDVARLVPNTTRLGALHDDIPEGPAPPSVRPGPALGAVFDPLVRRRLFRAATIRTSSGIDTPENNAWQYGELDPFRGAILRWAEFMPQVRWVSLSVHLHPLTNASLVSVTLQTAWYPGNVPAPTEDRAFEDLDTHQVHSLTPANEGAAAPSLSLPASEAAGVSFQVKPLPQFGGTARFAYRAFSTALAGCTVPPKADLYAVYFEVVATAHA